jgi:hypothetical protein
MQNRGSYCAGDALNTKAACDAASTCCGWVLPDPSVNEAGMTAADYCMKLNDKMSEAQGRPVDATGDADICTATTCCQMVTEQDTRPGPGQFLQVTRCKTRIGNTAQCKGSCKAKVRPTDTQLTLN